MSSRMKWGVGIIIIVIVVLIAIWTRKQAPEAPLDATNTTTALASEWKVFKPTDGSFSVCLPNMPQHASEVTSIAPNKPGIKFDMYLAKDDERASLMIQVIEYPGDFILPSTHDIFDGVISNLLSANKKNQLKSVQQGTFLGLPSCDFAIENGPVTIKCRIFLAAKTLFVLTAVGKSTEQWEDIFQKFVGSFVLVQQKELLPALEPVTPAATPEQAK